MIQLLSLDSMQYARVLVLRITKRIDLQGLDIGNNKSFINLLVKENYSDFQIIMSLQTDSQLCNPICFCTLLPYVLSVCNYVSL
jgi:hypothetical protein